MLTKRLINISLNLPTEPQGASGGWYAMTGGNRMRQKGKQPIEYHVSSKYSLQYTT